MSNTFHEYMAACTKEQYEEYGQIESLLAMRMIQSMGLHFEHGFKDDEGNIYYHAILVMSPTPLDNLHELFPGITTQWTHEEHKREQTGLRPQYSTAMKNGKLLIKAKGVSFRI